MNQICRHQLDPKWILITSKKKKGDLWGYLGISFFRSAALALIIQTEIWAEDVFCCIFQMIKCYLAFESEMIKELTNVECSGCFSWRVDSQTGANWEITQKQQKEIHHWWAQPTTMFGPLVFLRLFCVILPLRWLLWAWRSAPASAPPAAAAEASSAPPERRVPSQTAAPAPVEEPDQPTWRLEGTPSRAWCLFVVIIHINCRNHTSAVIQLTVRCLA